MAKKIPQFIQSTDAPCTSYLQINSCGLLKSIPHRIENKRDGRMDYHIIYVISGECEVEYQGESVLLNSGFVLYPPHTPQHYISNPYVHRIWIHFNGYHMEDILKEAKLTFGIHKTASSPLIENLFMLLLAEHNKKNTIPNEKGILLTLLYSLGELTNHTDTPNQKIDEVITLMTKQYNSHFVIEDLAKNCNLSIGHFMRVFKQKTGQTPHAYLQALRIRSSMGLLSNSNISISEIAILSGYNDPLYFSRIFKQQTGLSPSEYRKLKRTQ